jgi:PqqD family protein of HPr-rel-A system
VFEGIPSGTIVRRLGDAAVVFDPRTWQTHVLPPVATVIAEEVLELHAAGVTEGEEVDAAIREDLDLDPTSPEIVELLRMLREIGILGR